MVSLPKPPSSSHETTTTVARKIWDVIVVGGGLSGLVLGHGLQQQAQPALEWKLLEARSVLGGRLANPLPTTNTKSTTDAIDMGGAWIWPSHQPHMRKLVDDLNLTTFVQPDDASSTRIQGGAVQLVHALRAQIEQQQQARDDDDEEPRIVLNTPVTKCTLVKESTNDGQRLIQLETTNNDKDKDEPSLVWARRVVFCVPPKLVEKHVEFDPPVSMAKQRAWAASPTWMAGVTKVALVYAHKFWKSDSSNMGLPRGPGAPAFQVYDSSTTVVDNDDSSVSALTFFTLPSNNTANDALHDNAVLARQVATQMVHVWTHLQEPQAAQQALSYTHYHVQRWPLERYISEDAAPTTIHPHPHPLRALSTLEWNGLLEFAGSETDWHSPGVMEGAVSAANRVLKSLVSSWQQPQESTAKQCTEQQHA